MFFPSRGFLWGWALWGCRFLLGRGCASGKGPSSAFCPFAPLGAPAASLMASSWAPQSPPSRSPHWLSIFPASLERLFPSGLPGDFRLSHHGALWFDLCLRSSWSPSSFPSPAPAQPRLSWRPFLRASPPSILDRACLSAFVLTFQRRT